MGASASLLIATMVLESFIPLRCWIAPLMPTAMYRSGATTLPVWPTCNSLGTKPASTAARDAPTAPPSLSASCSSIAKLSPDFIPRPPETTTRALPSSGLSELDLASETKLLRPASAASAAATSSTTASPPSSAHFSKLVPRISSTFTASLLRILASALPAYMGRVKVSSPWICITSVTGATSNLAAKRGTKFRLKLDVVARTWL
mmetsp:Transcript_11714/g.43657  ORF Transcript_11714/g.43657 Transcript_11714/m.43657 type:complete len:205 (+) Transcript_11714:230-844(+)